MAKKKQEEKENTAPALGMDWVRLFLSLAVAVLLAVCMALYQRVPADAPPPPVAKADAAVPAPSYAIVNAHDHLYREKDLPKYLEAAEAVGISKTLFVASSEYTFMGKGHEDKQNKLNDWSTREILRCAEKYPGKIIAFATLHPDDENKVALLEEYKKLGAQGLKLYTGHGSFYDRPLDAPEMRPVYEWCQKTGFPICWHINLSKYADEFTAIMFKYPKLKVIVPHLGQAYYRPAGREMVTMKKLLDLYPGIYVDSSFGTRGILVAGLNSVHTNNAAFRAFYETYQNRVLFGTDMVVTGNAEKTEAWIESVLRACRDMHEKETYIFWMAAKGSKYGDQGNNPYGVLNGLALPPAILKKLYETNFEDFMALDLNGE